MSTLELKTSSKRYLSELVKIHKATGLHAKDICKLFPCGLVRGAYRLAGLPRPAGCIG